MQKLVGRKPCFISLSFVQLQFGQDKLICVVARAANIHDSKEAKEIFDCLYKLRLDENELEKILTDDGYQGPIAEYLKEKMNIPLEIVKRNDKIVGRLYPNHRL